MRFFEWLKSLFASKPLPVEEISPPQESTSLLTLPNEAVELMKKIENDKLVALGKELTTLMDKIAEVDAVTKVIATNQIHLIKAFKQQEEMIVAIATMHEEMLYQIEQGKVMIVKPQAAPSAPKLSSDDSDPSDPTKSKKNGQWN